MFAGSDLTAFASTISPDVQDVAVDVTAPGFEPTLVFGTMSRGINANEDSIHSQYSFGAVHWDGVSTITQYCMINGSRNGRPNMTVAGAIFNNRGCEVGDINVASTESYIEFSDFDSSGFSITSRTATGVNSDLAYLALDFGGVVNVHVGAYTTPAGGSPPVSNADTGPGFTPQFMLLGETMLESYNTYNTAGLGGQHGISVFTTGDEFSTACSDTDAATDAITFSLSDDQAVSLMDEDGSIDVEASLTSFDANGSTLSFGNVTTNAKQFFQVAIGEEVVPDTIVGPFPTHFRV